MNLFACLKYYNFKSQYHRQNFKWSTTSKHLTLHHKKLKSLSELKCYMMIRKPVLSSKQRPTYNWKRNKMVKFLAIVSIEFSPYLYHNNKSMSMWVKVLLIIYGGVLMVHLYCTVKLVQGNPTLFLGTKTKMNKTKEFFLVLLINVFNEWNRCLKRFNAKCKFQW